MNIFFNKDGKIFYEQNMYGKKLWTGDKFYFPNKRIDRLINIYIRDWSRNTYMEEDGID